MKGIRKVALVVVCCVAVLLAALGSVSATRAEADASYYVAISSQNYEVRNGNKMTERDGKSVLFNVRLNGTEDFYVTDGAGTRWYGADNRPVRVAETGNYRYDILFAPDGEIPQNEGWAQTGAKISYRFHIPDSYTVTVAGEDMEPQYIPYHTTYQLYVISSVYIEGGESVSWQDETHAVADSGYYRILFTPGRDGSLFDVEGRYGNGEDYRYHLFIEDAPQYYAVLSGGTMGAGEPDAKIDDADAYLLTRYERNVVGREYRTARFFVAEADCDVVYRLYEKTVSGGYCRIDRAEEMQDARLTAADAGWYALAWIDAAGTYTATLQEDGVSFGGWYLAGESNGYGYDAQGNVDLEERYLFTEVHSGEDVWTADYIQYRLTIRLSEAQVRAGAKFYITDGIDKYRNGTQPIELTTAGTYDFLFSPDHIYSRTLHYRYLLTEEGHDRRELTISTTDQFLQFARNCTLSADYSVGLDVYLREDLDFDGVTFAPVGSFSGNFYGGYHTMRNITLNSVEDTAIFSLVTQNGTVERLEIMNFTAGIRNANYVGAVGVNYGKLNAVTVSGKIRGARYVGGVVAYNGRTAVQSGLTDSNDRYQYARVENCESTVQAEGEVFVGGVVGFNLGIVRSSTSAGDIKGLKSGTSPIFNLGGIAGYNAGRVVDCTNTGNVTGGDDSLYIGGIAGLCYGEVYFSSNAGAVSASRYVGGIVGYYGEVGGEDRDSFFGGMTLEDFYNSYFPALGSGDNGFEQAEGVEHIIAYCSDSGAATAFAYAGGVLGYNSDNHLRLFDCRSEGEVEVSAGSYAGGIAGYAGNAELSDCISTGLVRAKGLAGGNYVGGIAGYGGNVSYSMSAATLAGSDYIGGIVGYATGNIVGCYTNVLISASSDAVYTGAIAGFAESYDPATNAFGGKLKANYYVGAVGGVQGSDFARESGFAAAWIETERLAADGMLSPYLDAAFSRDRWLGGEGVRAFPMLRSFEEAAECPEFDDDQQWTALFDAQRDRFRAAMRDAARLTYTVTFYEWNKGNGALYQDGVLQTDHFDIIAAVRVADGEVPLIPALAYATQGENGYGIYRADEAVYYVRFEQVEAVHSNLTVYAVYIPQVTTLESEDGSVLVEGEFFAGTVVKLIRTGEYYRLVFTYQGEELFPQTVVVKFLADEKEKFGVYIADGNGEHKVDAVRSGRYLVFTIADGAYFKVERVDPNYLPSWAWLLIGIGVMLLVSLVVALIVWQTYKKRKNVSAMSLSSETKDGISETDQQQK